MEINKENYKNILLKYFEDELGFSERMEAESYIRSHEEAAREWELLNQTRLKPDKEIVFRDKRLLFRTENVVPELKKPVFRIVFYRYAAIAAAAAVLAFIVLFNLKHKEQ